MKVSIRRDETFESFCDRAGLTLVIKRKAHGRQWAAYLEKTDGAAMFQAPGSTKRWQPSSKGISNTPIEAVVQLIGYLEKNFRLAESFTSDHHVIPNKFYRVCQLKQKLSYLDFSKTGNHDILEYNHA